VERGWLGVMIQEVTPELAESFNLKEPAGALVSEVMPDSPADKAGIKRGDVITKFDGQSIGAFSELSRLAAKTKPGSTVEVEINRRVNTSTSR